MYWFIIATQHYYLLLFKSITKCIHSNLFGKVHHSQLPFSFSFMVFQCSVLAGLFNLSSDLFGIKIRPADGAAEVWDDAVRFFNVYNEKGESCKLCTSLMFIILQ